CKRVALWMLKPWRLFLSRFAVACAAISRASGSLNNPTLSADNALSLVPMV
ncbi:hypothetical protein ACUOFC_46955, partial [Escherichia sp. TWPC-MK]